MSLFQISQSYEVNHPPLQKWKWGDWAAPGKFNKENSLHMKGTIKGGTEMLTTITWLPTKCYWILICRIYIYIYNWNGFDLYAYLLLVLMCYPVCTCPYLLGKIRFLKIHVEYISLVVLYYVIFLSKGVIRLNLT